MKVITPQPLLQPGLVFGRAGEQWPLFERSRMLACNSGRTAIYQACRLLNLSGPGRVLVPAYHCGAEVAPYQAAGLDPEFYPVRSDLSLDLQALEAALKPGVKVIHLTHFFGLPGPVDQVIDLAARYNLPLIEDVAHGLFSSDGQRPLGAEGTVAIFSLTKTLPVPDGGLLRLPPLSALDRTEPPRLKTPSLKHRYRGWRGQTARKVKHSLGLNTPGQAKTATGWRGAPTAEVGFDPQKANWSASPLTRKVLARADWRKIRDKRRANYQTLSELMSALPQTEVKTLVPLLPPGACPWSLPLKVRDPLSLAAALRAKGVAAWPVWAYFHPRFDPGALPEATDLKRSIMALPVHQDIDAQDCALMAQEVEEALKSGGLR